MDQFELFIQPPVDPQHFERQARKLGYNIIAGVDEVGRGALAGPVVAAAVILPAGLCIEGVDDSKKLNPEKREELYEIIMQEAVSVGVGMGSHTLIDDINILQATLRAMKEAVSKLDPQPDYLLIDGISTIEVALPQKTIKKGDSLSGSIAAASIIAKVTRDRLMCELDLLHPGYGLAGHKGYGCASHLAAIQEIGPSSIHRLSFGGVKEHVPCPSF